MPTNIQMINPDPTAQDSNGDPVAHATNIYNKMRALRQAELSQKLSTTNVPFMAHALAGHGGTVSNRMLGLVGGKSRFGSDKWLFFYTTKVYEYRKQNPKFSGYGNFNGSPNPTGTINAGETAGSPKFQSTNRISYQFVPGTCILATVYPSRKRP